MAARCCKEDTVVDKDRPRSSPCPRTLTKQEPATQCETVELPFAVSHSNLIYAIFAWLFHLVSGWTSLWDVQRAWILQIIFHRPFSTAQPLESTAPNPQKPDQPPATHTVTPASKPSPPTSVDNDPPQDWRLQMLMERRRREAERARHNPSIVVTFSGPTRVTVDKLSVTKRVCVADLSADEDGDCQPPLPFISPELVSRMAPCCSSPTEKKTSAFSDCSRLRRRRPSSSSSDTPWEDSTSCSTQSRSSSPTRCEDMTNTDEEFDEEEECTAVAHLKAIES
ncbi:hypothetical protein C8R45DRAFT_918454 [Mycena sanguinolenta]|nr:hypothetical protein C8R45DRAFT_918454 [Mycena sanguinolenta]